jgi:hypothetical protein
MPSWISGIQYFVVVLSQNISAYVTTTSFLALPIYYKLQNAPWSDEKGVHNKMQISIWYFKLHVTVNLHTAACSLSNADPHFFPKLNEFLFGLFAWYLYNCIIIYKNECYNIKRKGNWIFNRIWSKTIIEKFSVHLLETFSPPRNMKMYFSRIRVEGKIDIHMWGKTTSCTIFI